MLTDLQISARLFAVNQHLKGLEVSAEAEADLKSCARGEMDLETCRKRALQRFAKRGVSERQTSNELLINPDIERLLL